MAYSVMVDMPDGMVDRYEVLARSQEQLAKPVGEWLGGASPAGPDRATWGKGPQAKAAAGAMIAGGPAPLRPPGSQRPDAWKAREEAPDDTT